MSACKFWQTYKHMYTCVHISINILFSYFDIFCACSVLCAHVYMFVCLYIVYIMLAYIYVHICIVILTTANIQFIFSIHSQSLLFFILYLNMCYILYIVLRASWKIAKCCHPHKLKSLLTYLLAGDRTFAHTAGDSSQLQLFFHLALLNSIPFRFDICWHFIRFDGMIFNTNK